MSEKIKKLAIKIIPMAVIIMVIWAVANSGVVNSCNSPQAEPILVEDVNKDSTEEISDESDEVSQDIVVYVCGQVVNPGVYTLSEGSRLYEAVNLAGGLKKKANPTAINMAAVILDGDKIYIPSKSEETSVTSAPVDSSISDNNLSLVNINTASRAQLESLTGIGPAKASAIVDYRQNNGFFQKKEDLMKVSGIGQGTYDQIKEEITL